MVHQSRLRRWAAGFLDGARAPVRGFVFLLKHPKLWHYAILPMLISFAITVVVLGGLALAGYHLIVSLHDWGMFASMGGRVAEVITDIVLIAVLLAMAAGTYLLASAVLTGYFNERLAAQVEILLGTPASELKETPFSAQVADGILDFLVIAGTALGCFLLGCIPVVGILGAAINFYVDWFVFGYDYLEIPLALRGMRRKEKRAFAKKYRPQLLGLGACVFVLNLLPLIGNVLLTTAAIGAVLLHAKLRANQENGVFGSETEDDHRI